MRLESLDSVEQEIEGKLELVLIVTAPPTTDPASW